MQHNPPPKERRGSVDLDNFLFKINTMLIVILTIATVVLVIQTFLYRKNLSIKDYLITTIFVAMWGINTVTFCLRIDF